MEHPWITLVSAQSMWRLSCGCESVSYGERVTIWVSVLEFESVRTVNIETQSFSAWTLSWQYSPQKSENIKKKTELRIWVFWIQKHLYCPLSVQWRFVDQYLLKDHFINIHESYRISKENELPWMNKIRTRFGLYQFISINIKVRTVNT